MRRLAVSRVGFLTLIVAFYAPLPTDAQTKPDTIHEAAARGDLDAIRLLLDHGADVNAKFRYGGQTPMHLAIEPKGSPGLIKSTVELLLAHGANLEGKDDRGRTPLHLAVTDSTPEAVEVLLTVGADVNAKDGAQQTPLHELADKQRNGKHEIVSLLLTKHLDVNAKDAVGYTPLHVLAKMRLGWTQDEEARRRLLQNQMETARLLIQKGARVDARDDFNSTPLHWAAWSDSEAITELLLRSGADKNARDKFDRTPLHKAAEEGSLEVVEILVRVGVDLTARDTLKRTALGSALRFKKQAVADYLSAHNVSE
jgi:ankyrin repeat protein